ncbi:MAG: proline--tRNA ligase [Candidatus Omnitrophota bacterium]|nr:MAG: proline--tRNA ligase [Candidatus Omnitrophota bacterium]
MERFSQSFIFTTKEVPKSAEAQSHILALRAGLLFMVSAGIYSYLPLGYKALRKVEAIIRKGMDRYGAQELFMSALQPIEMWTKTGRDKDLEEVMIRFKDRKQRQLCLGPTHEELITEIVKRYISSYKQLPLILYQIQSKFRDEPRPRYGLIRSCEFIMKDAYSFDADQEGLRQSYEKMHSAYQDIFKECGLKFIMAEADPGAMGGSLSHEFMVPARIGEDILFACPSCGKYFKKEGACPRCKKALREEKMIEVGHIFQLGTKYSIAQEAFFLNQRGKRLPFIMGCYGIGVSRVIAAIIETNCDEKGISWPKEVAPYDAILLVLEDKLTSEALSVATNLEKNQGLAILVDDRGVSAGVKFNDALLLGIPYILAMGKNYMSSKKIDVERRKTREKLTCTPQELVRFFQDEYSR